MSKQLLLYRIIIVIFLLGFAFVSYIQMDYASTEFISLIVLSVLLALFVPIPTHIQTESESEKSQIYLTALEDKAFVAHLSAEGNITKINRAFCQIFNVSKEEMTAQPLKSLFVDAENGEELYNEMMEIIRVGQAWDHIICFHPKGGNNVYLNCAIFPIFDDNGHLVENLFTATDITEVMINRQYLQEQFYHDQLTGLPNRMKLIDDKRHLNTVHPLTLILFNIDNFHAVNDLYGNDFGDKVLVKIGRWLSTRLPKTQSTLYKLEADNYAILTTVPFHKRELNDYLNIISSTVAAERFHWEETEISVTFTIGAVQSRNELLKFSQIAYKEAKNEGLPYVIFDENSETSKAHKRNMEISKIIKDAVENNWVIPYFQPIVNLTTREIEKYEALMRIELPNGDVLMPDEFMEVAKHSRLYPKMSRELIRRTFEVFHISSNEFSINLSVLDILNTQTTDFIIDQLELFDVGPWVVFEILESEGVDEANNGRILEFIEKVKSYGAKIAIDDFGSGYSNFERLLNLQVDYIKIDGSLIQNIDHNDDAEIITRTIVSFARELGIQTIAEYVHSPAILQKVKMIGIDYAQGYHVGKPERKFIKEEQTTA